jgi:hypothetical protein
VRDQGLRKTPFRTGKANEIVMSTNVLTRACTFLTVPVRLPLLCLLSCRRPRNAQPGGGLNGCARPPLKQQASHQE